MSHNIFILSTTIFIMACQSYVPEHVDLLTTSETKDVFAERMYTEKSTTDTEQNTTIQQNKQEKIDLSTLVKWLGMNNPRVREACAEYTNARRLSQIKTPWPNPKMQLGVLIGSELNGADERRFQPSIAIGVDVPLGDRLEAQDNVYTAQAKFAYAKLLRKYRVEYLQLRSFYFQLLLMQKQYDVQCEISESLEQSVTTSEKLMEAGESTGLDVSIMKIELQQSKNEELHLQAELLKIGGNLFEIVGIDISALQNLEKPAIPQLTEIPDIEKLHKLMRQNNPDIANLHDGYEVAEKELELEITKQYPDITLQGSFEGDPGDERKIWGLSVEIPLPIFNRNQQAISVSKGNRNTIQNQYQNTLQSKQIELQTAYETYILAQKKFVLLSDKILSKAEENIRLTEMAVRSGNVDFLRYLEVQRTSQRIKLNSVQIEMEMYLAWLAIENIVGVPIVLFDTEEKIFDLVQQERE